MYFYPVKGCVDRFCARSNPNPRFPFHSSRPAPQAQRKSGTAFTVRISSFCANFLQKFPNCTKCLLYAIRENSVFCVNTLFLPLLLIFANSENGKNLLFRPDYTPCKAFFLTDFQLSASSFTAKSAGSASRYFASSSSGVAVCSVFALTSISCLSV